MPYIHIFITVRTRWPRAPLPLDLPGMYTHTHDVHIYIIYNIIYIYYILAIIAREIYGCPDVVNCELIGAIDPLCTGRGGE